MDTENTTTTASDLAEEYMKDNEYAATSTTVTGGFLARDPNSDTYMFIFTGHDMRPADVRRMNDVNVSEDELAAEIEGMFTRGYKSVRQFTIAGPLYRAMVMDMMAKSGLNLGALMDAMNPTAGAEDVTPGGAYL